ncbi:rhoptry-associated protein 3 [Plasmodium sp. gorilla clade G2]|uniref:rhoptry-associated protein 3 n=1 Tax=Plasmodium sp. gorilla clade G2 TaxID=880535 RepID=UPI000D20A7A3|nr:rhoptry-associated protein 3 [Plasmodium sp. gorilla clade G2]SOV11535.1 rhoptry-associated protein 3 [Plasmodium sp. gorilla clade G2]
MKRKFLISLFLTFLCLKNVVIGNKCKKALIDIDTKNFSLSSMLRAHKPDNETLGSWVYFFFNHFANVDEAIEYLKELNLNTLDVEDHACFARAFSIYLLHFYAKDIKMMIRNEEHESFFKNKLSEINNKISGDFPFNIFDKLPSIIVKEKDASHITKRTDFLQDILEKADLNNHAIYKSDPAKVFIFNEINFFRTFQLEGKPHIPDDQLSFMRDYALLVYLGTKGNYYNSDITEYAQGNYNISKKRTRLGLKKRSKTFALDDPQKNSKIFAYCEKNGKEEFFGTPDDLISSFFSDIKAKMVKGHTRFLMEFDYAVKNRTYALPKVKGFRFLKHLFQRKNLKNFVGMYINLMSTEIDFLAEDFVEMFDTTMNCYGRQYAARAADHYMDMKLSNIL